MFHDYMEKAFSKPDSAVLDATVLRIGSVTARTLFAWQASTGRLEYDRLVGELERLRDPTLAEGATSTLSGLDAAWAVRLARIMAVQNSLPDDRVNALTLFDFVVTQGGGAAVSRRDARTFCDLAIGLSKPELAANWLRTLAMNKSDRENVTADLINPFTVPGRPLTPWLELLNRPFASAGLEPLALAGDQDDRPPLDRVIVRCDESFSGPLVSIIVSCWQPNEQLVTSVRSLLAQTWRSVEIIVVDDASPPSFHHVLEEVQALDDRVTVLRQTYNQGTYAARNAALQVAKGEFVTFQDSDDWSHPRRIERQVAHLLANPQTIGVTANLLRVTETMVLGLPASPSILEALACFMFRREPVVCRIGFYDSVRKSADREYIERVALVFGQEIRSVGREPLGLCRLRADSLSRSEFKPGWRHAARNIYRDAFSYWHMRIAKGECSPFRSADPSERHFPAPRKFWINQKRAIEDNHYDFVFVGEWRSYGGPQKSMIEEILALKDHGYRIAICHQEALRFMSRKREPNCDPIRALIHEGIVDEVAMSDPLSVGFLVFRYPPILQFARHEPAAWSVGKAMIVANQAPHELDGADVRYRVADCVATFRRLFGVDAIWAPQGPQVRDAIQAQVPAHLLDAEDMPGILDVKEWRTPARRDFGARPIVGRYSRDNVMKFPADPDTLLQCYPEAPDIEVRIMGGTKCCPVILAGRGIPDNWNLLPFNDVPVHTFLANIDFFVYYDNDHIVEAFGRSILEALASGVLVILPRKFERTFGDAALYADPAEVEGWVRKIHGDPALRRQLSERSLKRVRERFSRQSYAAKMAALLRA